MERADYAPAPASRTGTADVVGAIAKASTPSWHCLVASVTVKRRHCRSHAAMIDWAAIATAFTGVSHLAIPTWQDRRIR